MKNKRKIVDIKIGYFVSDGSCPRSKVWNKMIDLFKNTFRRIMLKYVPLNWLVRYLKLIPDDLQAQEMCNGAIEKVP